MTTDEERWDETHKKNFREDERHSNYAEEREKLFPRGSLVLDIGGGTGADTLYFLQQGHSVVLIDISEFAINKAKEKADKHNLGDRLAVSQIDLGLHAIPVKPETIDCVYSRISLHYFGSKHTTKLFNEIYHVLKKGGSAYLTFKSPEDLDEMEYLKNIAVEYEPGVYIENGQLRSRFTTHQLQEMLKNAGISNFTANPYKEEIKDEYGRVTYLIANEVTFKKV